MSENFIMASNSKEWNIALNPFSNVDVCFSPEYHQVYSKLKKESEAILWKYNDGKNYFVYPFIKTPVTISNQKKVIITNWFDISSVYGYTGPLSTTNNPGFLDDAWSSFNDFAEQESIILEFIRFSVFSKSERFAHKYTNLEFNRFVATTNLTLLNEEIFSLLGNKTRNMIRKAIKCDYIFKELNIIKHLKIFEKLYNQTMLRNNALPKYRYDKDYFLDLLKFPKDQIKLYGILKNDILVSACIILLNEKSSLYHLSASLNSSSSFGIGNLLLYKATKSLKKTGVEFLTLGGGRTTLIDDNLFRFKKSNSTHIDKYLIGKRIINKKEYNKGHRSFYSLNKSNNRDEKLIFYR